MLVEVEGWEGRGRVMERRASRNVSEVSGNDKEIIYLDHVGADPLANFFMNMTVSHENTVGGAS